MLHCKSLLESLIDPTFGRSINHVILLKLTYTIALLQQVGGIHHRLCSHYFTSIGSKELIHEAVCKALNPL